MSRLLSPPRFTTETHSRHPVPLRYNRPSLHSASSPLWQRASAVRQAGAATRLLPGYSAG
ncbi:hypothetical protein BKA81DRAFT_362874 [Phyllosticta paracitricarpa]